MLDLASVGCVVSDLVLGAGMRRAARQDGNHGVIVGYFEKFGCSVWNTHQIGNGFPDIAVGKNSKTVLVEIKDSAQPASKRKLTGDESKFHKEWKGGVYVVFDLSDVIALVKGLEK